MQNNIRNLSLLLIVCLASLTVFNSCRTQKKATSNTKQETTTDKNMGEMPEDPPKTTNERGCEMYGGDEKKAKVALSLYREDFKSGNYESALPNWEYVFTKAPGLREQTFKDGDVMFKKMLDEASTPAKKKEIFDQLMAIYDQRAICWGKSAFLSGKKAYAYYKYYPEEEDVIFDFAEKSVLNGGNETPASQLQMYFRYLLKRLKDQKINKDELTESFEVIDGIIQHNLANGDTKTIADYEKAQEEIQPAYENLIGIMTTSKVTIASCSDAKGHFLPKYEADKNNLDNIKGLFGYMLKYKCYDDPVFLEVTQKYNELEPKASRLKIQGNIYRKKGDVSNALKYYQLSFEQETDNIKKAKLKMLMANMAAYEQANKDFPTAREHALEAAQLNPNWGKPYILIGRMYAGSGKLCGPGTGFESQKVLWPAMDMWNKAKQVDPASADEAQKYINQYYQYLPEKKDLFQRGISVGQAYSIKCWIGGTSKARVK